MTKNTFKLWIEYNLGIRKNLTEEEDKEIFACEFAMHLLVPTESINRYIELMGGIENVKNDLLKIKYLANLYDVPIEVIQIKLNYLLNQNIEQNSKSKDFKLNT